MRTSVRRSMAKVGRRIARRFAGLSFLVFTELALFSRWTESPRAFMLLRNDIYHWQQSIVCKFAGRKNEAADRSWKLKNKRNPLRTHSRSRFLLHDSQKGHRSMKSQLLFISTYQVYFCFSVCLRLHHHLAPKEKMTRQTKRKIKK